MGNYRFPVYCCLILLLCLGVAGNCTGDNPVSQKASNGSIYDSSSLISSQETNIQNDSEPIFEIKLVSPDLLKTILTNTGSRDQILKIGPGMTIGVSTPEVLYIRGDLQSDEYLLQMRNDTDIKDSIVQHLLAIVFGKDNANITLLQGDKDYMIWFDEGYTRDDVNTVLAFARTFNNLSTTTQFEDESVLKGELKNNYEEIPYHYYRIKITTRQFLDNYKKDKYKSASEELLKDNTGTLVGIIAPGYVYLWDGLEGQERRYYLIKSLLWNLGFHGETSADTDSFFYTKSNYRSNLSELDNEAIELLYGGRLSTGMNVTSIQAALDISL
ncbi:hypothetical protein [Methanospirillum lacunae]|uniref:Uncharacterized protein n=1 Tax=Methanospirillum lacunae TaxID=668570 RepID=A0A2V2N0M1_9EURY|nr:hypothetical protein [Methanospirillum lacunae]PWR73904.1 hypothetical protein DK846_01690 [Methanospirillum lacunae]